MATPTKSQLSPHAVIGVFIALLGLLFTLDNLHLLEARSLIRYWPLAPVGVGVLIMMQASTTGEWIKGGIWMAGGGLFLARSLGFLPFNPFDLWPLFLVIFGIKMVWYSKSDACADWQGHKMERMARRRQRWAERMQRRSGRPAPPWAGGFGGFGGPASGAGDSWRNDPHSSFAPGGGAETGTGSSATPGVDDAPPFPGVDTDPESEPYSGGTTTPPPLPRQESRVTLFALMSGVTRKFKGVFQGGQLTAIMGGLELDLRQAELEGTAIIDTLAFWGGVEIFVPEEWTVINQGFAFMGGFDDQTHSPAPGTHPRLIIRGLALMGGVEIKTKKKESWWKGK